MHFVKKQDKMLMFFIKLTKEVRFLSENRQKSGYFYVIKTIFYVYFCMVASVYIREKYCLSS